MTEEIKNYGKSMRARLLNIAKQERVVICRCRSLLAGGTKTLLGEFEA